MNKLLGANPTWFASLANWLQLNYNDASFYVPWLKPLQKSLYLSSYPPFKNLLWSQPDVNYGYIEKLPTITINEIISDTKWISEPYRIYKFAVKP